MRTAPISVILPAPGRAPVVSRSTTTKATSAQVEVGQLPVEQPMVVGLCPTEAPVVPDQGGHDLVAQCLGRRRAEPAGARRPPGSRRTRRVRRRRSYRSSARVRESWSCIGGRRSRSGFGVGRRCRCRAGPPSPARGPRRRGRSPVRCASCRGGTRPCRARPAALMRALRSEPVTAASARWTAAARSPSTGESSRGHGLDGQVEDLQSPPRPPPEARRWRRRGRESSASRRCRRAVVGVARQAQAPGDLPVRVHVGVDEVPGRVAIRSRCAPGSWRTRGSSSGIPGRAPAAWQVSDTNAAAEAAASASAAPPAGSEELPGELDEERAQRVVERNCPGSSRA